MNSLLAQFIPEARDLLEQAGVGMLALEQDATSQTVINDVFRAVHTLKGSSGLFDVAPLTRLVHAAEDLLDEVRTGELSLTSDIVDRLLDSLDLVGRWIDVLEVREELPGDAESSMTELVKSLRSCVNARAAPGQKIAGEASGSPRGIAKAPDWAARIPEAGRIAAFKSASDGVLLAWTFTPEENCFFRGDDPVAMLRHSPGLLAMRALTGESFASMQTLDPLNCVLRFEVLSKTTRDLLEEHMRYVAEFVEIAEIDPFDLAIPDGVFAESAGAGDFAGLARPLAAQKDKNALSGLIESFIAQVPPESYQASALRWCFALLDRDGFDHHDRLLALIDAVSTGIVLEAQAVPGGDRTAGAGEPPLGQSDHGADAVYRETAYKIAAEQIRVLETPADPALTAGRLESVAAVLKNVTKALGIDDAGHDTDAAIQKFRTGGGIDGLQRVVERLARPASGSPVNAPAPAAAQTLHPAQAPTALKTAAAAIPQERAPEPAAEGKPIPRVLRVDQSKIDEIMNLVAELIVAKNGLSYLATRAEDVHGSRVMAREIKDQFAVIDRITQGLQVGVMSVRMMPVSQVFQRFPRLVRDIARKLEKKIDLVIEGEETEADKNVLESLADPLIHMVRNSLDHGIETPEDRRAAGKPETGTLKITARQENDFVVIEVSDDGKGIDPERVKAKALQLGLISPERANVMTDAEAANLVFAPGFSTKEEVSDLSGRGVGMDVVRSAVVKAGGDVSLRSALGVGTSVIVRLPLTMAVTRIVTIECRNQIFGIPMDLVVETVRITHDQVHRIKDMETFVLRDTIIPILRLADSLRLPQVEGAALPAEEAVMVVRVGGQRVGVIVDGFRERLEVIVKPLEGVLEGMSNFSGTALLGDGRVLLILDLQEII